MRLVLDDPKQWSPRRLLIKFTSWSWKIAGFRINQYLSNWASHVSELGPSFMKIWICGSSPRSSPDMPERGLKTSTVTVFWATFGIFSARSKWFPVGRDWWLWTKPGYITMTRRQSNNQWSGRIAAHAAQKFSKCKNLLEKFSPRFFGIKTSSSSLIIFQRARLPTRSITHLCWCNWKTLWKKNAAGSSPTGCCSCTTMPRLTGHLHPRRNWPIWASIVLITHPILRFWSLRTTTCSLDWKNNWKFAIFRATRRSLLPRRPGWTDNILIFFWVAYKS